MKRKQAKYRLLSSILLIGIYLFIATPKTLWHQHHHPATTSEDIQITDCTSVQDCPVCSQEYSPFTLEEKEIALSPLTEWMTMQTALNEQPTIIPSSNDPTRGPPAI